MSRVYEALRKAESQRSIEEQPTIGLGVASETIGPSTAGRARSQIDFTVAAPLRSKWMRTAPEQIDQHPNVSASSAHSFVTNAYGEEPVAPHSDRENRGPLLVIGNLLYPAAAEQFHRLSLTLQSWATDNDKRIFTIMSALSEDGKSFVALNLAASLAMSGNRVILVDCDLRQPTLHRSFNMETSRGLMGYLEGEIAFSECVQSTAIPRFSLVQAGGTSYTPAELLGGRRMKDFIREARSTDPATYLILDSPASSLVPEAQILNRLGDASLVVVAANQTPRELVKQTIQAIGETPVIGLVLNRFESPYSAIAHYPYSYKLHRGPNNPTGDRVLTKPQQTK
jgi:capsular exopolysaccharide synthesis family protein